MAMDGDALWVASGPHAIKYFRGKEVRRKLLLSHRNIC